MSNQQEFLDYLKGLGDTAPKDVRELAHELYGVEAWLMKRTKSGKKFGVELLIDDDTLRAIGHVSAQWGVLEIEFDGLLLILVKHPNSKSIAPKEIPQAFDRRAKLFRDCAKLVLHGQPDLQKELIGIINEASSARGQRDDVIHGHWHLGRKKGQLGTAVTVINRRPSFKAKLKNMSADQVEDVAANISQVTAKLIWWRTINVKDSPTS